MVPEIQSVGKSLESTLKSNVPFFLPQDPNLRDRQLKKRVGEKQIKIPYSLEMYLAHNNLEFEYKGVVFRIEVPKKSEYSVKLISTPFEDTGKKKNGNEPCVGELIFPGLHFSEVAPMDQKKYILGKSIEHPNPHVMTLTHLYLTRDVTRKEIKYNEKIKEGDYTKIFMNYVQLHNKAKAWCKRYAPGFTLKREIR